VSVKIRLKRMGKIRAPYYRIVVADSRTKRDGRAIEEIGKYHPTEEPSYIEVDSARAQHWLGVGAQPTEQVLAILKVTGDWQKFKGLPGAEGTLRTATPRADKKAVFAAAAKETLGDSGAEGATTPKGSRKKAEPKAAAEPRPEQPAPQAAEQPAAPQAAEQPAAQQPAEQPAAPQPAEQPVASQPAEQTSEQPAGQPPTTDQPADAADEGAPGGSETSAQVEGAGETAQAEG
jgi:small subunit ribosomal protein S16